MKEEREREKMRRAERKKSPPASCKHAVELERLCNTLSATLSTTLIINQRHANYIELYC